MAVPKQKPEKRKLLPEQGRLEENFITKRLQKQKQKMLQRLGKASYTSYTPEFSANNTKAKEMIPIFEEYVKATKKHFNNGSQYCTSGKAFAEALRTLGDKLDQTEYSLGPALVRFADVQTQIHQWREEFQRDAIQLTVDPIANFVEHDVMAARRAKERFRQAKIAYDAADAKMQAAAARAEDPMKLFMAHTNYYISKRKFQRRFVEASNALEDVIIRKDFDVLQHMVRYMDSHHNFFYKAYDALYQLEPYLQQLREAAAKRKEDYAAAKRAREEERRIAAEEQEKRKFQPLVDLLASPDLALIHAICVACGTNAEDGGTILEALVRILDAYQQTLPIIKLGITAEVESTSTPSTLFRANSTATKLMTAFTKLIARPYLMKTIKGLIENLIAAAARGEGFEVDPNKAKKEENVEENAKNLMAHCQNFLNRILESLNDWPMPFREITAHLQTEVVKRFPDSRYTAVGGFLFLRFLCPAILAPEKCGLAEEHSITKEARRALILVGKALQNLANGVKFGNKEAHMVFMNDFIESNDERVKEFFDAFTNIPSDSRGWAPLATIDQVRAVELPEIFSAIVKNLDKIAKNLVQHENKDHIVPLCAVLGQLGDPSW